MNLTHLKYVIEVDRTKSISKAAENLFMGQPNLSRVIKDLEAEMGITVFKRTSKGMEATAEGKEFLSYARRVVDEVEEMERIYSGSGTRKRKFSVAVNRVDYAALAFSSFIEKTQGENVEYYYREVNNRDVISLVESGDCRIGIVRYNEENDDLFGSLFEEKSFERKEIYDFEKIILCSDDSPLSSLEEIDAATLSPYTCIQYGDAYVPALSVTEIRKTEGCNFSDSNAYVFDRIAAYDALKRVKNSYMFTSPSANAVLKDYSLHTVKCLEKRVEKDVLIYKKSCNINALDRKFFDELIKQGRTI